MKEIKIQELERHVKFLEDKLSFFICSNNTLIKQDQPYYNCSQPCKYFRLDCCEHSCSNIPKKCECGEILTGKEFFAGKCLKCGIEYHKKELLRNFGHFNQIIL